MHKQRMVVFAALLTAAAVSQIVLACVLYNHNGHDAMRNLGWLVLWLSAAFGWLPILDLRRWGGVPQGKGYIRTTQLVDRGTYAIVRHPQYLAGVLLALALSLIAQHVAVAALGALAAIFYYFDAAREDAANVVKFGPAYRSYMERVPRFSFLGGLVRWLRRRREA